MRSFFKLPRTEHRGGTQQTEVAGRKRIRIAERPHRDVLRGPIADSRQLPKPDKKIGHIHHSRE